MNMKHLYHQHLLTQFFFFCLYLYCFMSIVESLSGSTDREALLLSFKQTVSDRHHVLNGWKPNVSHCTWYGVTCSMKGSRVRSLNLSGLGLSGPISPQISNLSSLFMLDLSENSFAGPIPSEFGRLSHLQHLVLERNSINGTIPVSLSECQNLKTLYLAYNNLTGNIPSELGHLQKLEVLDFSINYLTGVLPVTFGNLTSLIQLYIARNQLFGEIPSELGRLPNLGLIQLSENQFSGEIPDAIFNISSLDYLSLTDNKLEGKLPSDLGYALPNLRELALAKNNLSGMLPSSLSNASHLEILILSVNSFQGPIPLFGNMNNLVVLDLGQNPLSSTTMLNFQLIDSLKNCTQLKTLQLFSNKLAGRFPNSISNLSTHLQHFCIADNLLTGSFPQGIEKFHDLISLSIEQNSFTGEIPRAVGMLKSLQKFLAYENMFSGEIPDIFGNLSQLSILEIGRNQFSGRIPISIRACQQLDTLGLGANRLHGSIPKEIFELSTLVKFYVQKNALSGPFPGEVGNLKQLQFMDISDNQLSGNISSTIGLCSSLQSLNMSRNNFIGYIPSAIGKLASLEKLDLSSNRLIGAIPEGLGKLHYLVKLNLSFNHLEGEVLTSGVFMNLSQDSLQGNKKLCHSNKTTAKKLGLLLCIEKKQNMHFLLKIIVSVVVIAFLINVLVCFMCAFKYWKRQKAKRGKGILPSLCIKGLPPHVSYSDIQLATDDFAVENLIGKGAFGSVYKGVFGRTVHNGSHGSETIFAVKVLDLQQSKAAKSFDVECEALRNIRHRNLVKVITSCSSIDHKGDEFKALVMEFMSHGNLDKWLYDRDPESGLCLTLLQRLNIAIDIASAIDYLHHDCDPPVVHCDLKPGNVLLDDDMVAHVGDFGLARFLTQNFSDNGSSTIGLKGSIGYIAPEYGLGGKASTYGDVYGFGMLLLEVFIAKKPTDEMFEEGLNLNKFASAINENHVLEIADPRLFKENGGSTQSTTTSYYSDDTNSSMSNRTGSSYCLDKVEEIVAGVIRVGLSCAAHSAKDRLTMREVLTKLQAIKKFLLQM